MQRVPVESKALKSLSYDAGTEYLEIEFHNGNVYRYEHVPRSVYEWLLKVPNKGGFVNRVLEPKYPGTRVPDHDQGGPEVDLEAALRASLDAEPS